MARSCPRSSGAAIGGAAAVLLLVAARRKRPLWAFVGPGVAVALLIGGSGLLVAHGRNTTAPPGDAGRSEIVSRSVAWIRANVPPGSTIAYGEFLAYETAYNLAGDYGTVQIRARLSTSAITAPDGMARAGEAPADDWVAIDIAPRNVYQFYAYRAHWLTASFARTNATYWVYTTGVSTSSLSIEAALTTATGFQKLTEWSVDVPGFAPYHTSIYKVDPTTGGVRHLAPRRRPRRAQPTRRPHDQGRGRRQGARRPARRPGGRPATGPRRRRRAGQAEGRRRGADLRGLLEI